MGEVYAAEHLEHGRRLALKLLRHRLAGRDDRARFLREGQLAASINHPHAVYIFGSEEIGGAPVITMELLPGGTLKEKVAAEGPLAPAAAVDAILNVIGGLDAACAAGILHRDIKPSNCFVDHDGSAKIGDFGLSISTLAREVTERTGLFQGTPQFAAPEQLRGDPLDVRADIYAVGATLFYLLTGTPPFDDADLTTLVTRIKDEQARSPRAITKDIPTGLAAVVVRCLAKDRRDRPASYAVLNDALRPFSSAAPVPAPLGRRVFAGFFDWAVLAAFTVAFDLYVAWLKLSSPSQPGWLSGVVPLVSLAYWAVLEGRWGASVGKRICDLRIVDHAGRPPGVVRAGGRWIVFSLAAWIAVLMCGGGHFGAFRDNLYYLMKAIFGFYSTPLWGEIYPWLMLSASCPLQLAILFASARRRNGFAGLHDLLTGIRVVEAPRVDVRRAVRERAAIAPVSDRSLRRLGPYEIVGSLGTTDAGTLLCGFDPALRRDVWLHVLSPGAPAVAPGLRDLNRPGRLRWLNGRRLAETAWDAYEAPGGVAAATMAQAPQAWSATKHWLLDLAEELRAADRDASTPLLRVDRVWINKSGRAMLLDVAPVAEAAPAPDASGQVLLARVARMLLGRSNHAGESDARRDPPLPLSVHTFLSTLDAGGFRDWTPIVEHAKALMAVPDRVAVSRRAVPIAACGVLPVFAALNFFFMLDLILVGAVNTFTETLTIVAGAGLVSACLVPGGVLMRASGIAIVTASGLRASWWRIVGRTCIAWSPVLLIAWSMDLLNRNRVWQIVGNVRSEWGFDPAGTHMELAIGLALAFGGCALWAIVHPARGLQDRVAGTWLVPR